MRTTGRIIITII